MESDRSDKQTDRRQRARRNPKRILIVENHPATRSAMATLINLEPDLTVCGRAGTASRALAAIKRIKPDLVLTDLNMPGKSGLELIREIRDLYPELPVVVISIHDEVFHVQQALRAGAKAYVAKSAGGEELLRAIRRVIRRRD